MNVKDKSYENISSPSCLNVSSSSKGKPQDELDTNKNFVSHKLSKSFSEEQASVSSPSQQPVLESAPSEAKLSRPGNINNNINYLSSSSNKEAGWEWDTIKGRGWRETESGKQGRPPANTNITFITDPELCKKLFGDYEHLWINFSKPPWKTNNKRNNIVEQPKKDGVSNQSNKNGGHVDPQTCKKPMDQDIISDNLSNMYIAKEEQSRKDLHSHHIVILNTENLEAGNRYDPYANSSECSSECSYNHKSENK